jgi:hypothetical protein
MIAIQRAAPPKARNPDAAVTAPGSTMLLFNSANDDSTQALQLQFLSRHGVVRSRVGLIAGLLFGERP